MNKKEEIISLLDELDEDSLDLILNLIKRKLNKDEAKLHIVDPDAKELWDKACDIIKQELTELSYNTWIKNIVPIGINDNILRLAVETDLQKSILEGRYSKLFRSVLLYITDKEFEIEFIV